MHVEIRTDPDKYLVKDVLVFGKSWSIEKMFNDAEIQNLVSNCYPKPVPRLQSSKRRGEEKKSLCLYPKMPQRGHRGRQWPQRAEPIQDKGLVPQQWTIKSQSESACLKMLSPMGRASLQTPCRPRWVKRASSPSFGEKTAQQAEVCLPAPFLPEKGLLTPLINDKHCRISPYIYNILWSRKTLLLLLHVERKPREAISRMNSIPVGMTLEKQAFLHPSSSPEDWGCSGLPWWHQGAHHAQAHDFCATSDKAALHRPSSHHTRSPGPAAWAQPGSLLDPHCRDSTPYMGKCDRCSPGDKAPVHALEPAATAGQQHRQTQGSCTGQKHTTASIMCVLGQIETNYYSHPEKQFTKITIFKDPCY